MNFKRFGLGKQLINPSIATYGKYIDVNGVEQTSASGLANHTDYISVIANYTYTVSYDKPNVSGNTIAVSWYDSNKNFIIRDSEAMPFELGRYKFTKTAPNNAAFAIVNFTYFSAYTETQNTKNYIFAIGESQLPYEPYGSTWDDTPFYIYGTSTDTFTTFPVDLYADGNNATVGLKGNMSQTGTPTPQSPIQPQECGEMTGNLWSSGDVNIVLNEASKDVQLGLPEGDYVFAFDRISDYSGRMLYMLYENDGTIHQGYALMEGNHLTIKSTGYSVSKIRLYIAETYADSRTKTATYTNMMLNTGSQPLPYEPYGYKIPISSANATTPVYLGEVESERRIKKLVLTGEESWTYESAFSRFSTFGILPISLGARATPMYCSHFRVIDDGRATADVPNNSCYSGNVGSSGVYFKIESYTSSDDFKAYVAQQYANGTPITLWMILRTETTGIVNEPLRKIGDYADTVSGISIPTTTGKDTFDVETTLKPSEVSLAYTGWHNAEVKEWDGSEWQ